MEYLVGLDYLAIKLAWYIAAAFAFGLLVGWLSCGRVND